MRSDFALNHGCRERNFWMRRQGAKNRPKNVPPPVTSGTVRGMSGHPMLAYGGLAFIIAAFWLVNSLTAADDAMRRGGVYRLSPPMFFEGTSAIVINPEATSVRNSLSAVRA
jgi:hypothetical protein